MPTVNHRSLVHRHVVVSSDERQRLSFFRNAASQGLGEFEEAPSGHCSEIPLLDLLLKPAEQIGVIGGPKFARAEEALSEIVQLEGARILNREPMRAAPGDQGATGNTEFGGDAGQGLAARQHFDETFVFVQ